MGVRWESVVCCMVLTASFGGVLGRAETPAKLTKAKVADTDKAATGDEQKPSAQVQAVDLFDATEAERIKVQFIPLGSHRANVIFTNATGEAIDVQLPRAFGAVQILGQLGAPGGGFAPGGIGNGNGFGNGFGGPGGLGMGGAGGGGQGIGGGFGGGGFGGGGNLGGGNRGGGNFGMGNAGNGLFRIQAGKTRRLSVNCVCLEFGKPDPSPRMKYQMVRLEELNDAPEIRELCEQLGDQTTSQTVAQAAAWNLANGLSWEELRQLNKVESQFTGNVPRFSKQELAAATKLVSYCRGTVQSSSTGLQARTSSRDVPE